MRHPKLLALTLVLAASALPPQAAPTNPVTLTGSFASALVMDAETGDLLIAVEPHLPREPASMVKMMTELLVLEAIDRGELSLDAPVTVSARASRMGGSQVYLKEGEVFTVEELLMALAIHSANDAAQALAEHLGGTALAFVDLMNLRARELGMRETEFHSVHGLPPGRDQQPDVTSAYDMAILGRKLVEFPEARRWGATETAPFRGGEFTLYNPNGLIGKYRGLDGIKTGYHDRAGYCVTASAVQKDRRLIAVVMGAPSEQDRTVEASRLLTYGFNLYSPHTFVDQTSGGLERLKVKDGKAKSVALAYAESLTLTVRKDQLDAIIVETRLAPDVTAPVAAGQVVGKAVARLGERDLGEVPIVAAEAVAEGSFFEKLFR